MIAQAQCPAPSCDISVTGVDITNYTLWPGDTLCLQSTALYTGQVTFEGGVLINCASSILPSDFAFSNGGIIDNHGTIDLNNDLDKSIVYNNYGTTTVLDQGP